MEKLQTPTIGRHMMGRGIMKMGNMLKPQLTTIGYRMMGTTIMRKPITMDDNLVTEEFAEATDNSNRLSNEGYNQVEDATYMYNNPHSEETAQEILDDKTEGSLHTEIYKSEMYAETEAGQPCTETGADLIAAPTGPIPESEPINSNYDKSSSKAVENGAVAPEQYPQSPHHLPPLPPLRPLTQQVEDDGFSSNLCTTKEDETAVSEEAKILWHEQFST